MIILFAAALAACQPGASSDGVSGNVSGLSEAGLELTPLTVTKANGETHRFSVEIARTPEQQERGMMFRESMGEDEGMIFPYANADFRSFWMKNTLIPLDIIYVKPDKTIANIAAMTQPMSLDFHYSTEPVNLVLELKGGRAAELGIQPGDKVEWPK